MKTILIAVPTNKYVETETMKSIYSLKIPEGFKTRLEFFYGYQIDQIRNLIAEWGKKYDYTFFVDSDIILPRDSLEKLIGADKSIVSGLYIQRKPGQQIVEIYEKNRTGGVSNVPFERLKNRGLVKVAGCGFGCVLVKKEVFLGIPYPHFYYTSALDHSKTISEDVYFCKKAAENGYDTYADTSLICSHIGSTLFEIDQSVPTHLEKIAQQDLLPGTHTEYLHYMKDILNVKPKIIYDIGACVLHWTRKAKEVWPESEVILFDGSESVRPFLEKSGMSWSLNILSDTDGKEVDFYEDPENPGGNSYYKETTGFYTEEHKKTRRTWKLDTIVDYFKWPLPNLIKLDVQGAEKDILIGAEKCLNHASNVILEAQHTNYNQGAPKYDELIRFMETKGFKLEAKFSEGTVDADYHFRRRPL